MWRGMLNISFDAEAVEAIMNHRGHDSAIGHLVVRNDGVVAGMSIWKFRATARGLVWASGSSGLAKRGQSEHLEARITLYVGTFGRLEAKMTICDNSYWTLGNGQEDGVQAEQSAGMPPKTGSAVGRLGRTGSMPVNREGTNRRQPSGSRGWEGGCWEEVNCEAGGAEKRRGEV
jgi:hypothetical protein